LQRAEGRDGRGRRASVGCGASIRRQPPRVAVRVRGPVGVRVGSSPADVSRGPRYHRAHVTGRRGRRECQPLERARGVVGFVATRVRGVVQSGEVESSLRRQRMIQEFRLENRVRLAGDDAWRRRGSVRVGGSGGGCDGGGVLARGRARRERRDRDWRRSAGGSREARRRGATSRGKFAAVGVGSRRAK